MNRKQHLLVAVGLACLVAVLLSLGHRTVGYARDEGVYFEAGRRYGQWVADVGSGRVSVSDGPQRDRAFRFNNEHPALMKTAAGVSARLLARPARSQSGRTGGGGVMPEGAAMRLPAQLLAAAGVAALYLTGVALGGPLAGLLAAGWFIALPRVWFHAGLCAFDVPIAVMTLFVVLAYRRALSSVRWGIALGLILGLAVAIKHNALFLGPLLAAHYYGCLAWARVRRRAKIRVSQLLPLPLVLAALITPIVAIAAWPWLWHDTLARIRGYFEFHLEHQWYNMEYLGQNFNLPPLPVSYPWVMTWATVPTVLLLLAAIGLAIMIRRDVRIPEAPATAPTWRTPLPPDWCRHDGALLLLLSTFPLALISLPSIPIFGGTKHWLTAYPFLALAAAVAFARLTAHLSARARASVLALVLAPSMIATVTSHPQGLSQYAPMVGGARGAAEAGLARGFWGHSVTPLLRELPADGPIYLHDVHTFARDQYVREGRWSPGLTPSTISRSASGLLFHELHMTTYEVQLWNHFKTSAPGMVVTLHDVPLTSYYLRPPGEG